MNAFYNRIVLESTWNTAVDALSVIDKAGFVQSSNAKFKEIFCLEPSGEFAYFEKLNLGLEWNSIKDAGGSELITFQSQCSDNLYYLKFEVTPLVSTKSQKKYLVRVKDKSKLIKTKRNIINKERICPITKLNYNYREIKRRHF